MRSLDDVLDAPADAAARTRRSAASSSSSRANAGAGRRHGSNIRCCWPRPAYRASRRHHWQADCGVEQIRMPNGGAIATHASECRPSRAPLTCLAELVRVGRQPRHPFRPVLPQRARVQLRAGCARRPARADHIWSFPTRRSILPSPSSSRCSRSSSTPGSAPGSNGIAAGSTIASWPSGCGRCAA